MHVALLQLLFDGLGGGQGWVGGARRREGTSHDAPCERIVGSFPAVGQRDASLGDLGRRALEARDACACLRLFPWRRVSDASSSATRSSPPSFILSASPFTILLELGSDGGDMAAGSR